MSLDPKSLRYALERDAKSPITSSFGEFLKVWGFTTPFWAAVVMPMSTFYQISRSLVGLVLPKKLLTPSSPVDSGYTVKEGDIVARAQRKYDIVVMGATGFVGKLAVRYLTKNYGVNQKIKWAIAGRSKSKLETVKAAVAKELGIKEVLNVDTIVVDTSVPATLPNLVRDTRAVVTTAGPFWQYGNSVVEFCAKFGTHYSDITGESGWVKSMMLRWQETAKKTGARLVPLSGHDCIPWDLTISTMAKKLQAETGEDLAKVECYDEVNSSMSGGTLATMMLHVGGSAPPPPPSDPFRQTAEGKPHTNGMTNKCPSKVTSFVKPWDGKRSFGRPFVMARVNYQVVGWSQALRGGAPLSYSEVLVCPDFKTAFVGFIQGALFVTGLLNPLTRYFFGKSLLKPGEGPSMHNMQNTHFLAVTVRGTGTKGSEVDGFMYFPRDAGYLDTARMLVESGLCLALEEEKVPAVTGGFFAPGYGLGDVLLQRLEQTGTTFEWRMVKSNK